MVKNLDMKYSVGMKENKKSGRPLKYSYDIEAIEREYNALAKNGGLPNLKQIFISLGYEPSAAKMWINRNYIKTISFKKK